MPQNYTFPGVYVEEIPSGVRTITGVSTSDTAFVDFFTCGPVDRAVRITSLEDFSRQFGGLDRRSEASYAIQQFYLNGGSVAWVVRVHANAERASRRIGGSAQYSYLGVSGASGGGSAGDALEIEAANPGAWGNNLEVGIDYAETRRDAGGATPVEFNLVIREVSVIAGVRQVVQTEVFRNLSNADRKSPRFVESVINEIGGSALVRVKAIGLRILPQSTAADAIAEMSNAENTTFVPLGQSGGQVGSDGIEPGTSQWREAEGAKAILGDLVSASPPNRPSISLLGRIAPDVFNLLCIPAASNLDDASYRLVVAQATAFCKKVRAFYIVDLPEAVKKKADMTSWVSDSNNNSLRSDHAATYFPRITIADPLNQNRSREVGPSGTIAGIYARTDSTRGIWKAPAGTEAVLIGATPLVQLTDLENGEFNPKGVNILRVLPVFGSVAWGARTLDGADAKASEWKYIPVRRTALFIEESLYQGLKWVVFEPNDEPLWSQIRLNVGAFMNNLFRQGAFQGGTSREAYFVKCDKETTTQNDINLGIVNILVGFAPLKPAEFVVIKLQQMAGQISV